MKRLLFLCLLLSFVLGCSIATRPNISALYHIPALKDQLPPLSYNQKLPKLRSLPIKVEKLFQKLYSLDPVLALEVGKLPDFQKEIRENQITAMAKLIEIIANATAKEKETLAEFMKVGRPNIRRYCTPLQAILWLLEKPQYDSAKSPLICELPSVGMPSQICSLRLLLSQAWNYSEKDRWGDYEVVTDRLNAPELIDHYERDRFRFFFRADHVGNAFNLFRTNKGQCADVTDFTVYCLRKAGYKAGDYHVASPSGYSYHHVTLFEVEGKDYIMDNGRPDKRGIVPKNQYSPF